MAEAAIIAGLGWVLSPLVADLIKQGKSYLGSDIIEELQDLETKILPQIQLTVNAAQHSSPDHKAMLANWLEELKKASNDAEVILREVDERLKHKAKGEHKKLGLSSIPITPLKLIKKASKKKELLRRLKKLTKLAAGSKTLLRLLATAGNSRNDTSALLPGIEIVIGRDEDRDNIINYLLDEQGGNSSLRSYSVVAITGVIGVGKTKLAKYVYNNERVMGHFPKRMWLCLSGNLDIVALTKEMIECASEEVCPNLVNFNVLQNKLIEALPKSDKVLVVIDNVWYDTNDTNARDQWKDLLNPFNEFVTQGGTCKIVVTSRSISFPVALQPGKQIELSDLPDNDFILLLKYHAIDCLEIRNPELKKDSSDLSNRIDIVKQIAKIISKSPLEAVVVGSRLCERPNIMFWQDTLGEISLKEQRQATSTSQATRKIRKETRKNERFMII